MQTRSQAIGCCDYSPIHAVDHLDDYVLDFVELSLSSIVRVRQSLMNETSSATTDEPGSKLSTTERSIADLWNEVLRTTTSLQPMDNFFALGGDSMAMVTLEFRIAEELGIELPAGTVLSAPTLRELSTAVDSFLRIRSQTPTVPVDAPSTQA